MTSILTNNGAMVALQTLKTINNNLESTQNAISTGKEVASAKDNSAIWAISKVMESDVAGFNAVSDSLALGESTVAVATAGAEQITELLKEMKEKVVAATGENVDNDKITADVDELKNQITSIISASQFNGANLLNSAGGDITVLSSLDRDSTGAVTSANITVSSVDFESNLDLTTVDVSSSTAADASISEIEALIQTAVDGAAALGASAARIEKQSEFVSKVTDAMKSGIGSLVDTDMEEASARLKALQTQQQLGVQALSIANSAPQTLQQLFR
ncbi:flagellin N-terminal helical domain-containing protein [Phycobacter azelaicus]|jgi:flagellin|uniref:flagellin N-terminal helical domain-containing protein n=1 Tax=Phycobacter azelaicus TaxID=2668075 RepID=UPI0018690995|nr:flagellin [Phycobacter azelaicus]MBE1297179.1 flagellin [Paracoccaceae bacterium]